jgi:hypothetical protein
LRSIWPAFDWFISQLSAATVAGTIERAPDVVVLEREFLDRVRSVLGVPSESPAPQR